MKRTLGPPRRDKPTGNSNNSLAKKIPIKLSQDRGTSIQKVPPIIMESQHDKVITQKYEQKYRNKNLNVLPMQMLVTLSGLTTIDISYNKLTDSQIELIMNSCNKLTTFCMQGNMATIIPAAISHLKQLVNFRHDWVKLYPQEMYQTATRLERLKQIGIKQQFVVKVNKLVGIDFASYCFNVLYISMDKNLLQKIEKCDCSSFARANMLKFMEEAAKGKIKQKQKLTTIHEGQERSLIPGCFGALGLNDILLGKKKQERFKDSQSTDSESFSTKIKIQDIRDITDKEATVATMNEREEQVYVSPGFPLHQLFANFDRNPHASAQIDGILIRGINPNQYDTNGLSPYHLCVINKQKKGVEHLIQISSNNPGFFDLQMPSVKQGRSLLHFSVFLKNYQLTKMLIEFGLPIQKRDASGARIVHLVDQNYQFLILLRKLFRKRSHMARSLSVLAVPLIPAQKKKNYVKHPQRQKQESRFRITYSKNDKLLQMYESATGLPNLNIRH